MNMVAASAFSREGADFSKGRGLPLSAAAIVRGKLLFAMAFNIAMAVPMAVVGQLILGIGPVYLIASLAVGLLGLTWATTMSMAIDAFRPYLSWNHPQKAMKNSLNGIVAMAAVTGLIVGMGWLVMKGIELGVAPAALLAGAVGALAVMAAVGATWLFAAARDAYRRIEQ